MRWIFATVPTRPPHPRSPGPRRRASRVQPWPASAFPASRRPGPVRTGAPGAVPLPAPQANAPRQAGRTGPFSGAGSPSGSPGQQSGARARGRALALYKSSAVWTGVSFSMPAANPTTFRQAGGAILIRLQKRRLIIRLSSPLAGFPYLGRARRVRQECEA